jgi:hypothetical protein
MNENRGISQNDQRTYVINEEQNRMNNPEKLKTFDTQDTWQTQTKTKHNTEKRWAQRTPPKTALNPDDIWDMDISYSFVYIFGIYVTCIYFTIYRSSKTITTHQLF